MQHLPHPMNVMNHNRKIYDKGKFSTGSLLAEFYSLNQNSPSSCLPPECHSQNLHKNITDNRRNKATEKERVEARNERKVANSL